MRKITALFSALIFILSFTVYGNPDDITAEEISSAVFRVAEYEKSENSLYKNSYLFNSEYLKNASDSTSLRYLIALGRFGYNDNYDDYGTVLKDIIIKTHYSADKLTANSTELWHNISLGLMACGINPQNIETENGSIDIVKNSVWAKGSSIPLEQGSTESLIRGLIVLDANNTILPQNEDITYTREYLIEQIMSAQEEDGSFHTTSALSKPEITAMAVYALAPYRYSETLFNYNLYNNKKEQKQTAGNAIFNALEYLSGCQSDDGGFKGFETKNLRITSEVITALCSLNIDLKTDSRFIKNGNTLMDALLSMQNGNGSISENIDKEKIRTDSSFALKGLVSYYRFLNGQTSFYDFTDCRLLVRKRKSIFCPNLKSAVERYVQNDMLISSDDYEPLVILTAKAKNLSLTKENEAYLEILNKKTDELYKTKEKIAFLNEHGNYLSSPQAVMGTKNLHAINKFIEEYEALNEKDRAKVLTYEAVSSKKEAVNFKLIVTYTFTAFMYFCMIISALLILLFLLRISPLWKYIIIKIVPQLKEDEFGGYFDLYAPSDESIDTSEDFLLPYENNEDFFILDEIKDAQELSYLPFEPETAFPYLTNLKSDSEEDSDVWYLPDDHIQKSLPYVQNTDFFVYHTPEELNELLYFDDMNAQAPLPYVDNEDFFVYDSPEDFEELTFFNDDYNEPPLLYISETEVLLPGDSSNHDDSIGYFEDYEETPLPHVYFQANTMSSDNNELWFFPDYYEDEVAYLRYDGDEVIVNRKNLEEAEEEDFKIY